MSLLLHSAVRCLFFFEISGVVGPFEKAKRVRCVGCFLVHRAQGRETLRFFFRTACGAFDKAEEAECTLADLPVDLSRSAFRAVTRDSVASGGKAEIFIFVKKSSQCAAGSTTRCFHPSKILSLAPPSQFHLVVALRDRREPSMAEEPTKWREGASQGPSADPDEPRWHCLSRRARGWRSSPSRASQLRDQRKGERVTTRAHVLTVSLS